MISAPSTTSFSDSEWFPQELQSDLSLAMHSLSESESATKRGNASAIVNMHVVAIIPSKCQQLLRNPRPTRKSTMIIDMRSRGRFREDDRKTVCLHYDAIYRLLTKNTFDGDLRHWRSTVVLQMTEISVFGAQSVKI